MQISSSPLRQKNPDDQLVPPVYIAGLGAISAIGNNVAENVLSLQSGRSGIGKIEHLSTLHKEVFPVGEVKSANEELAERCGWTGTNSRSAMLAYIAAREALLDAGFDGGMPYRTGLVSATSVGGMDLTENFYPAFLENNLSGKLRNVVQHECGAVTERVAKALGITEFVTTISTACSSSANAIMLAARMIRHGLLDIAIAGGTDALSKFTLNGFNTLMILDHQLCQPFDQGRRGLNLGEGAGFVVLTSEKVADATRHKKYARLTGYCNANDAHHQTASSPEGIGSYTAMMGAMAMAGLAPGDIDYINLHGTGTQNNDASESTALHRIFGTAYPRMSSTKSFTGHTLAACGGIEAVYSVLSLERQCLFPGLRITTPVIEKPGVMVSAYTPDVALRNVLSNSFGFGGNCSSLIFSQA
ncbi:beta-ketoacyl-[acyl-carrier-protein] synthase family protein [Flavihumibacter profundi]|uniref:beta-ketoacyl-[acyl-carrier-protein] synthase family protein n=1 Tax=Flavihumibacter profundi TaxID=2716883 RepID=UPI001CC48051|nr:beta-ketoacyl-[acyl-carrier-protein] synthase family protein [Flavihumibacter profundi]MBZ5858857.1 beta-ketoacyl-[acyl-carrier-protein] synthase family protein [Flavihumibacter profundi]